MAKAILGAALIATAVAATLASGGAFGPAAITFMDVAQGMIGLSNAALTTAIGGLAASGVSMEAGAIANALTSNRGMAITTRQSASARQIIYGQQRVGGVIIYRSTTGGHKDQMNFVIVLAGHECDSIAGLYLDGRQVFFNIGSGGNSTRNGVNFGGSAASGSHTGPNGVQYDFGGLVYCEARYGDQVAGDYITGLTANDPVWAPTSAGTPSVMGCTYVYLKIEYDTNTFPGEPEIRFTVNGKNNIWDPRTSTYGFTQNWALVAADVITDTQFGLGDNTVNQAQLIAAANVCDEQVPLGRPPAGQTEARYTTNHHYDTTTSPGSALMAMMPGAAGRVSRIGGEWYLWPAYWQGPAFSFDENSLVGPMEWEPYRGFSDLVNRVRGTYIAPNFPYNIAGNLYDSNGFYNGQTQNNFPFAFQPTNYPEYACDVLHGYASDQYLNADGQELTVELNLQTVLSVSQAQRVAKIMLLRNRQQGSGTFKTSLAMWQMQPCDVMQFTFPQNGWQEKYLEVVSVQFMVDDGAASNGTPSIACEMKVQETAASVYAWSVTEELTVYDVPAYPQQNTYSPAAPTNMTLTSGPGTALQTADGVVHPRIEVQWNTPEDVLVKQIQIQYSTAAAPATWIDAGLVDVSNNLAYISGVVAGQQYNVRIRSLRANGAISPWTEIDGYTVSLTLSVVGISSVAQNALVGEAFTNGTAGILVSSFTAVVGNNSVSCLPGTTYEITGLAQTTAYYVYYIDPNFAGGAITPIATINSSDFLNKPGYFLIGSVITPYAATSGGSGPTGSRYQPTTFTDSGSFTTTTPAAAFDGVTSTAAVVGSRWRAPAVAGADPTITVGNCSWQGFPSFVSTSGMALNIVASVTVNAGTLPTDVSPSINFYENGVSVATFTAGAATNTYSYAIPTGTNLSTLTVNVRVQAGQDSGDATAGTQTKSASASIYEIYIQ